MECPTCGAPMRPLFVGEYCPNDCDRKRATSRDVKWWIVNACTFDVGSEYEMFGDVFILTDNEPDALGEYISRRDRGYKSTTLNEVIEIGPHSVEAGTTSPGFHFVRVENRRVKVRRIR